MNSSQLHQTRTIALRAWNSSARFTTVRACLSSSCGGRREAGTEDIDVISITVAIFIIRAGTHFFVAPSWAQATFRPGWCTGWGDGDAENV